jgi:hypothetical protein
MRRPRPNEKERRTVKIPAELREALREVHCLIAESERDPDVRVDYGDAIQCGCLVGGRTGTPERPYELTYYPHSDRRSTRRWRLSLHPLEIEDIVDGCMAELTLYCCRTTGCEHKSSDPEDLCDCDYVEDPYFGNIEPANIDEALRRIGLPQITRSSTRADIVQFLGEPQETGGGRKIPPLGYVRPWIKYYRPDCQVRFEFGKSGALRMLSVLEPDWEPGM